MNMCTENGLAAKHVLINIWTEPCLSPTSQGKWRSLVDPMALCCIVKWKLTFFPELLKCPIQLWISGYDLKRLHPTFTRILISPVLVSEIMAAGLARNLLLLRMITTRKNVHACLNSCRFQFFGNSFKKLLSSCWTNTDQSRQPLWWMSSLSLSYRNEGKICIHWIIFGKWILVSTNQPQTK